MKTCFHYNVCNTHKICLCFILYFNKKLYGTLKCFYYENELKNC